MTKKEELNLRNGELARLLGIEVVEDKAVNDLFDIKIVKSKLFKPNEMLIVDPSKLKLWDFEKKDIEVKEEKEEKLIEWKVKEMFGIGIANTSSVRTLKMGVESESEKKVLTEEEKEEIRITNKSW